MSAYFIIMNTVNESFFESPTNDGLFRVYGGNASDVENAKYLMMGTPLESFAASLYSDIKQFPSWDAAQRFLVEELPFVSNAKVVQINE